jgi:hypothetical protein
LVTVKVVARAHPDIARKRKVDTTAANLRRRFKPAMDPPSASVETAFGKFHSD